MNKIFPIVDNMPLDVTFFEKIDSIALRNKNLETAPYDLNNTQCWQRPFNVNFFEKNGQHVFKK